MAKNENKNNTETNVSKSKSKREARKKEVAKERRNRHIAKITGISIVVAIAAIIVIAAGKNVYLAAIRTVPGTNFSEGLTADGKIDGVNVQNVLTLVDFANIPIPAEEVAATDEEVESEINSTLEAHKELNSDDSLVIADSDTVNIDYVGTIDGVEFEGGNSNGEGYDLTIGSGSFIDDFEQQLIGHKPGENVTVNATFPEDYSSDPSLAGKEASFAVTINGIMKTPELTDEFVSETLAGEGYEDAKTAEEYRNAVKNHYYEQHLRDYLTKYIVENSTVNSYPSAYVKSIMGITKYDDEYMMQYYNQMFSSYGMETYQNVWSTRGEDITDELSYEKELRERAKEIVKDALVYQGIFEAAGLSIDMDAVIAEMTEENGEEYVTNMKETYGDGYIAQSEIRDTVIEYLMELYK